MKTKFVFTISFKPDFTIMATVRKVDSQKVETHYAKKTVGQNPVGQKP
jgi:hypothetical protein